MCMSKFASWGFWCVVCLSWQRICLQCRRPGFDPWVGKVPWRREGLPIPLFWPGEFHGLHSPQGHKELGKTEWLSLSLFSFNQFRSNSWHWSVAVHAHVSIRVCRHACMVCTCLRAHVYTQASRSECDICECWQMKHIWIIAPLAPLKVCWLKDWKGSRNLVPVDYDMSPHPLSTFLLLAGGLAGLAAGSDFESWVLLPSRWIPSGPDGQEPEVYRDLAHTALICDKPVWHMKWEYLHCHQQQQQQKLLSGGTPSPALGFLLWSHSPNLFSGASPREGQSWGRRGGGG